MKNMTYHLMYLQDGLYKNLKTQNPSIPDVVIVGPSVGRVNPAISISRLQQTVHDTLMISILNNLMN